MTDGVAAVWDTKVQQFHGGQDWKFLNNFVEDFSVTTNALGTPKAALEAAKEALCTCHHYPPADQEPARTALARFLWPDGDHAQHHDRLLLGNGASELIDLLTRLAPAGTWKPGPWDTQYKEYERSAEVNGRMHLDKNSKERAMLTSVVNPCNPTGDYMSLPELKTWINDNVQDGGVVLVDESMQPWHSSAFRQDSLVSQHEYLASMHTTRNVSIYMIHSWTKIWSCTGLRLGSVVCPTRHHCDALRRVQVPWSVNAPALAFMAAVVEDRGYMQRTWELTPLWRTYVIDRLRPLSEVCAQGDEAKRWSFNGREFLSWVWIDVRSERVAEDAMVRARKAGVPIRSGRPGYNRPTFVRVAVREPEKVELLVKAWEGLGVE